MPVGSHRSRAAGRRCAPPRLLGAAPATALLAAPALLLFLPAVAASFEYERTALAAGQWWRALTCHWTHWSADHLAWDLTAFVVLAWLAWRTDARRLLTTLVLSTALIPLAVWLALPEMERYRGLSGVDSALFALVAVGLLRQEWSSGRRGTALAVALAIGGFVGKVGVELATGATLFADDSSFVPVPLAHIVGAACGVVVAIVPHLGGRRDRASSDGSPAKAGYSRQAAMNTTVKSEVAAS